MEVFSTISRAMSKSYLMRANLRRVTLWRPRAKNKNKMNDQIMANIDDLLERLDRREEMEDFKQLELLKRERKRLLDEIEFCDRVRAEISDFFFKTKEIISLFRAAISSRKRNEAAEDCRWLAYWGIEEGNSSTVG